MGAGLGEELGAGLTSDLCAAHPQAVLHIVHVNQIMEMISYFRMMEFSC